MTLGRRIARAFGSTSYRLWDTFYATAEVALGGWFARPEGSTKAGVEGSVIAEAEWLLAKRR